MSFICPICKEKLNRLEKASLCPNGHSFDLAAQGYVHLLPPNKMHAKIPGDSKLMVSSRRRFLEAGFYRLFSNQLNELALTFLQTESPVILDAGCGEGYYTGRLYDALVERGKSPQLYGFDISKFAIKAAAKKYRQIQFAVGSIFDIPVASGSVDCVVDIFAPIVESEFHRVLKSDGYFLLAVPGERHLFGLKEILYEAPYENEHKETEYEGFTFITRVPVRDTIQINGNALIMDLFAMTPYYWKTTPAGSERLKQTDFLETEIAFDFLVYQKMN